MKEDCFKYINERLKDRALSCWETAISKSREGDTKAGTRYMGRMVKGVTNPHHGGFSIPRIDELTDVLAVLSRDESLDSFVEEFLGCTDHFFRQEDNVIRDIEAAAEALKEVKKLLEQMNRKEKSFGKYINILDDLELLESFDPCKSFYQCREDLKTLVSSSEKMLEKQRAFNSLNNYEKGNIGQGNKEAIVKLYNFFVRVLGKWEEKEGRKTIIKHEFLNELEEQYFVDFLFKDEDSEGFREGAVRVPNKFLGSNQKGITPTVFKLIYQVVDALEIDHIKSEIIGKIINKRSDVAIPERILVKADDTVEQIQRAEEELDRASEPYILFPDGSKIPDFYDHVERETPEN